MFNPAKIAFSPRLNCHRFSKTFPRNVRTFAGGLFVSVSVLAFPSAAAAFDFSDFLNQMKSNIEKKGGSMTFGTVTPSGDGGNVRDLRIVGANKKADWEISNLNVENVTQQAEGDYAIGRMNAEGMKIRTDANNQSEMLVSRFSASNIDLPPFDLDRGGEKLPFWPMMIGSAEISDINFDTNNGNQANSFSTASRPRATVSSMAKALNQALTLLLARWLTR